MTDTCTPEILTTPEHIQPSLFPLSAQKLASQIERKTIINDLSDDPHRVEEILRHVPAYTRSIMEYGCALRELETRLRVINDEFGLSLPSNPIEYIETRIKTTHSIYSKLSRREIPISVKNMEDKIFDIAGIRIICSFVEDVYRLADSLRSQNDLQIIQIKDYIQSPKPNGYRSYHMIVEVPFYLSDRRISKCVELQFRTIAMDFWASLEHKMRYKKDLENKDIAEVHRRLKVCAEISAGLDDEMQEIRNMMHSLEQ